MGTLVVLEVCLRFCLALSNFSDLAGCGSVQLNFENIATSQIVPSTPLLPKQTCPFLTATINLHFVYLTPFPQIHIDLDLPSPNMVWEWVTITCKTRSCTSPWETLRKEGSIAQKWVPTGCGILKMHWENGPFDPCSKVPAVHCPPLTNTVAAPP